FFSSRRRHTRSYGDWSSDVCSSDLDAAAAFGARPSAVDVSLSPDGSSIAFVAPTQGMGSVLYTVRLDPGAKPKAALTASGKPERSEERRVGKECRYRGGTECSQKTG